MVRKTKATTTTTTITSNSSPQKKTSTSKRTRVIPKSTPTSLKPLVIGRDDEKQHILSFLKAHCTETSLKGGSLYISGSPGSGKTALIKEILNQFPFPSEPIYINCMTLTSPQTIFQTIYKRFQKKNTKKAITSKEVEAILSRLKVPLTIVLDEIDQLSSTHSTLLYNVFKWSLKPRLALIGIANSLDLTERLLPLLRVHHCVPRCVSFPAYTAGTLQSILGTYYPHFSPSVLHFVATKVSATSSDVRHALTVCQHASRVAGDGKDVCVSHVAQVMTPRTPWVHALKQLSWASQLALLAAVSARGPLSFVAWHAQYHRLASELGMPSVSVAELRDMAMHLETLGLILCKPACVVLNVPPNELVRALTAASVVNHSQSTAHELFKQVLDSVKENVGNG